MTGESSPHDNDADGRPRVQMKAESKHGYVEVVVHGGEGETASDIEDVADDRFEDALDGHESLRERDDGTDSGGGFQ